MKPSDEELFDPVRPLRPAAAVLETVLLAAVVPLFGHLFHRHDPFFVRGPVSWPLLVPLVAGLRHGIPGGIGGAAALSAALMALWRHPLLPVPLFPGQLIVALLLVGMVSGQFAHLWASRARRIGTLHAHQGKRFGEFARHYQLLKVSHDALEEESAAARGNLRTALAGLRAELLRAPDAASSLPACAPLALELFQAFGQVQAAALLPVAGERIQPPCASLGELPGTVADDPLVRLALRTRRVASLPEQGDAAAMASALVAAVPLVDVDERVWGILAVKELPFHALTGGTLRLFALLGGAIADTLAFGASAGGDEARAVERFVSRVRRCLGDARRHGIPSVLVVLAADRGVRPRQILVRLLEQRRSVDEACLVTGADGRPRLHLLLPLVDEGGARGFLDRVAALLERELGATPAGAGVRLVHCVPLGDGELDAAMTELLPAPAPRRAARGGS